MRKIYENLEFTLVGYFKSLLDEAEIASYVKNAGASVGMGEIPFTEVYPELWVIHDEDYEKAMEVLRPHHEAMQHEGKQWQCPACGNEIEGSFGQCWNCGEMRPG